MVSVREFCLIFAWCIRISCYIIYKYIQLIVFKIGKQKVKSKCPNEWTKTKQPNMSSMKINETEKKIKMIKMKTNQKIHFTTVNNKEALHKNV